MSIDKKLFFETKTDKYFEDHFNNIRIIYRESDGYINATKFCKQFNKEFKDFMKDGQFERIARDFYEFLQKTKVSEKSLRPQNIDETTKVPQISGEPSVIENFRAFYITNTGANEVRGTYVHPLLISRVAYWASEKYSFYVDYIMNQINTELHLRNITLEQKIKEQEEQLKNANSGMKVKEGSIILEPRGEGFYHILYRQIKENSPKKDNIIYNYYNAKTIFNQFLYYVEHNLIENISVSGGRVFKGSAEKIKETLDTISTRKFVPTKAYNEIIEETKKQYIKSYNITKDNIDKVSAQIKGRLFELMCAEKYKLYIFSQDRTNEIGVDKRDVGADVMDYNRGIIAQCKYINSKLRYYQVEKFINFCKDLYVEDISTVQFLLIVNEHAPIPKTVESEIIKNNVKIVYIPDYEFNEYIEKLKSDSSLWEISPRQILTSDDNKNKITNKQILDTLELYIKLPTTTVYNIDGKIKYAEPKARFRFNGMDFGRIYRERVLKGEFGEEVKQKFTSTLLQKYQNVQLNDENKLKLLTEFRDKNQRIPNRTETTSEGIRWYSIYSDSIKPSSAIRNKVFELFSEVRQRNKPLEQLPEEEIIQIYKKYFEKFHKKPTHGVKFSAGLLQTSGQLRCLRCDPASSGSGYRIYPLFEKIMKGTSKLSKSSADEIINVFKK